MSIVRLKFLTPRIHPSLYPRCAHPAVNLAFPLTIDIPLHPEFAVSIVPLPTTLAVTVDPFPEMADDLAPPIREIGVSLYKL
jgi:hypothetical protein